MGVAISRYAELSSNELLARFCSTEVICPNDPFWNQLLAFNITPPGSAEEQLIFDSSVESLLQQFLQHNPETGNLGSLVHVFITRATELLAAPNTDNSYHLELVYPSFREVFAEWEETTGPKETPSNTFFRKKSYSVMLAWQTFNAVFVIRAVTKYLVEMVPEYEVCRHLDVQPQRREGNGPLDGTPPDSPPENIHPQQARLSSESRVEMLIDALIGIVIDVPVTDNTYFLHLECINTLLVLMSVYMFSGVHGQANLIETSQIYRALFAGRYTLQSPVLVRTLLHNLSAMYPAPPHMFRTGQSSSSILISLASNLWSALSFTSSSQQTIYTHPPLDRHELLERLKREHPVANQSCLLLLALANHCMDSSNLYRSALLTAETTSTTPQKETNGTQVTPPRIDMDALHKALCACAGCEHFTLLLYLMLHSCKAYKTYVTNAPHVENLIVPILQVVYNAPDSNSHHIYMSLIVLLILTEDDALIKSVHQITLKNLTWYTERSLSEISLGGLMVLVILRALQYNMARVRDKYLHTNCLAAIANMSCEFRNLHPYVAQRLVSLFETLAKRRARLCSEIEGGDINTLDLPHHLEEKTEEIVDHIGVLDEVLRMLLEILNCCLTHQLQNNLNLVYALLHKRHIFQEQKDLSVAQNIHMVIGYFSTRLQRVQDGAGGDLGVTEVLQCIKRGAEQWSSDRLKKFPDLKFRYVEEEKPEEFFTPYVWCVSGACGCIHWGSEGGARALATMMSDGH